jgi:hypothetical protein
MEPADSIRRLGFARWYERRLIEAHTWLISGIACLIAIGASVEELGFRVSAAHMLWNALIMVVSAVIGTYGVVRYQKILVEAEQLGEQATCAGCGTYARFKLISTTEVRCRKCAHEWRLIHP